MRRFKYVFLAAFAAMFLGFAAPASHAQISIGIGIGAEPVCPYGYYGFAPYNCAPYGYYGPQWFSGGRFIGAGRWYHGGRGFYGPVDRRFDPRFGYHGGFPHRGEGFHEPNDHWGGFHGNAYHDYRGHGRAGGHHH